MEPRIGSKARLTCIETVVGTRKLDGAIVRCVKELVRGTWARRVETVGEID